jgi:AcrR family transcriptional regulator
MTTTGRTTFPRRARARRGEGERLRADILQAAERLLFKTGDADAVSIRAVAEAVGVTPPSIYLHFADKTDLIFQICQQHLERFHEHMRSAVEGIEDPVAWLETIGRAYIRWGLDNPEHYRILFMSKPTEVPEHVDKQDVIMSGVLGDVLAIATKAVDEGKLTGDPALIGYGTWAAAHGLTSLLISCPDMPWPDVDQLRDALLDRVHRSQDGRGGL